MLQAMPLLLVLMIPQDAKKTAEPPDDEVVRGLPDGPAPPLPERVNWDLSKAVTAKTSTRERINLAGPWRFAPLSDREAPVLRGDMGWIQMPGLWTSEGTAVYDSRFRAADGVWRGKPLDEIPFAWAERDISISNAETIKWLSRRVFLVMRGSWTKADIFASQRSTKPASDPQAQPDPYVNVEPVTGAERDGTLWSEITEQLIYPGKTQISMRLKSISNPRDASEPVTPPESYIGLELVPTGLRVESMHLRHDTERGDLEAKLELVSPIGVINPSGPPIRTIPMTLKILLEDAATKGEIHKLDQEIGPMTNNTRTVTVRIPFSVPTDKVPAKVRLRVWLNATVGGTFDEPFPIEFQPGKPADRCAG